MIKQELLDAINDQINYELESYYIYLSMSAYFSSMNLDGMAHWMRVQAHEEMIHAMKFFDHIIERGGKVVLKDIKQLKTSWSSPKEAWDNAYEHEQLITSRINNLMAIARKIQDFTSEPLLQWFVNEQIEEEVNTSKISQQMALIKDNPQGLFMLDSHLATRPFPAGSPFDPLAYNVAN